MKNGKTFGEAAAGLNDDDFLTLVDRVSEAQRQASNTNSEDYRKTFDGLEARFGRATDDLLRNLGIRK